MKTLLIISTIIFVTLIVAIFIGAKRQSELDNNKRIKEEQERRNQKSIEKDKERCYYITQIFHTVKDVAEVDYDNISLIYNSCYIIVDRTGREKYFEASSKEELLKKLEDFVELEKAIINRIRAEKKNRKLLMYC